MADEIEELVTTLAGRVTVEAAEAVNRAFELRFAGDERRWYLDLTRTEDFLSTERPEGDVCGLGVHVEDLRDLLDGNASLSQLFSVGRLRVFDNIGDAMRLERVFRKDPGGHA